VAVGWIRDRRSRAAMILVVEIVDFERFHRPRALMAYLGLVASEYSSGDTRAAARSPRRATAMRGES
jgi:transposase